MIIHRKICVKIVLWGSLNHDIMVEHATQQNRLTSQFSQQFKGSKSLVMLNYGVKLTPLSLSVTQIFSQRVASSTKAA